MGSTFVLGGGARDEPRRALVLLNPAAGQGRKAVRTRRRLAAYASPGLKLLVPDPAERRSQMEQAREILEAGVDAVVVFGGDGMVHAAAQLLDGRQVPIGVVPTGTGNDFARAAGVARNATMRTLRKLLDQLLEAELRTTPVDMIKVSIRSAQGGTHQHWVINSVNIGFDARANQRANKLKAVPGHLRYIVGLAQVIPSFRPVSFRIAVDGMPTQQYASALVCLQNGPYIGGGIPLARGARTDDGRLDLSLVGPLSRKGLVALFPLLMMRLHSMLKPLTTTQHQRVVVGVPPHVPIYADGDELVPAGAGSCEVEISLYPGALQLLR